MSVSGGFFWG